MFPCSDACVGVERGTGEKGGGYHRLPSLELCVCAELVNTEPRHRLGNPVCSGLNSPLPA